MSIIERAIDRMVSSPDEADTQAPRRQRGEGLAERAKLRLTEDDLLESAVEQEELDAAAAASAARSPQNDTRHLEAVAPTRQRRQQAPKPRQPKADAPAARAPAAPESTPAEARPSAEPAEAPPEARAEPPAPEPEGPVPAPPEPGREPGLPSPPPADGGASRAAEFEDTGHSTRRYVSLGFLLLLLTFGGIGAWAVLAPLQSAVIATGTVNVESGRKTVQHLEGGIIDELLVREGDRVGAGQDLIRLDDTQPRATYDLLSARRNVLKAQAARLVAERDGLEVIEFPAALAADPRDPELAKLRRTEQDLFRARREALKGQLAVFRDRLEGYRVEIAGLREQIASTREQLGYIDEELVAARFLYEQGNYDKPRMLGLQRRAARLKGEIGAAQSAIARSEQSMAEVRTRVLDLQNQRLSEVTQGLQQTQTQLLDVQERLHSAKDVLERIVVRAPQDGVVVGLEFTTQGGVIPPRAPIMDIVPADDTFIVDTRVKPQDIDVVQKGLPAEVRLTAYNMRTTPTLHGEVVRVSADRLYDETTEQYHYLARVKVDMDSAPADTKIDLYPGMPAEVHIVTGGRTPFEYIVKPLRDSMSRAWSEE